MQKLSLSFSVSPSLSRSFPTCLTFYSSAPLSSVDHRQPIERLFKALCAVAQLPGCPLACLIITAQLAIAQGGAYDLAAAKFWRSANMSPPIPCAIPNILPPSLCKAGLHVSCLCFSSDRKRCFPGEHD